MTVRRRLMLLVMLLITLSVLSAAALFAAVSWRGMAAQARQDGELVARLLAQTVSVAQQAPMTVDEIAGRGLAGQAVLVAKLVEAARRFSTPPDDVDRSLRAAAAAAELGEVWVTDRDGRPLHSSLDDIDAKLGEDDPLLRENLFAGLRSGLEGRRVIGPLRRETDGKELIIGAARLGDGDGMAVVAQDPARIARASARIGLPRLLAAVAAGGGVDALWVTDGAGATLARTALRGPDGAAAEDAEAAALTRRVAETSLPYAVLTVGPFDILSGRHGRVLAAAPVLDHDGLPSGVAALSLPADHLETTFRTMAAFGGGLTLALLAAGMAATWLVALLISRPIGRVTQAAAEMEALRFVPESLDDTGRRSDELGRLARVFQSMAREVMAREEHLEGLVRARTAELQAKNELLEEAHKQMEEELRAAQALQAAILPQQFPSTPTHQCDALMVPALQLGGDFYDLFAIDDDHVAVAIADVSGKGVRAAFFMAISRTILQNAGKESGSPGECLRRANDLLCQTNPMTMFVTVFYGVLNIRTGHFRYANGGHNPPQVIRSADGTVRRIPPTGGMALGIMEDMDYAEAEVQLTPGDTVFLYTDGVSEAMDIDGNEFTEERLTKTLSHTETLSIDRVLQRVRDDVKVFVGEAAQSDDLTCLVLRYAPVAEN